MATPADNTVKDEEKYATNNFNSLLIYLLL